jgi:AraC-like DNA-binding protein
MPTLGLPRLRSAIEFDSVDHVDFHAHDTVELCLVKRGSTSIEVAGLTLHGKPGSLFVLPANVRHNQRCAGHWRTHCVLFEHDGRAFDERPRVLDFSTDALFSRWAEDLCRLSSEQKRSESAVANALLFTLVTRVLELERGQQEKRGLHPSLERALAFLDQHLKADVDAEELSRAAATSYSHLSGLFRKWCGHGPMHHHRTLRMELAKKLLQNSYLSVSDVANELGYDDLNYFVRVFRKSVGVPPGAWRSSSGRSSGGKASGNKSSGTKSSNRAAQNT